MPPVSIIGLSKLELEREFRRWYRPPNMKKTYELLIVGGGGASALARRAGQAGVRTALVDPGPLGGTCPNRGCIPSKILLQHATAVEQARRAPRFFADVRVGKVDSAKVFSWMRREIAGTHEAIAESLGASVDYHQARAEFVDPFTVRAGKDELQAKRVVLSMGARPTAPAGVDRAKVPFLVSDDVFKMKRAPRSLAIVGGGFIACEFAHFFAAMGTEVTMVERSGELLMAEDEEVRSAFCAAFCPRIDFRGNSTVASIERTRGGFRLRLEGKRKRPVEAEALLYAIGRRPNTDGIGLERTGIAIDERGFVKVDDRLRTNVEGVWALGDVNGRHMFTHATTVQAEYLGEVLFEGRTTPIDHGPMPHAVFTEPEVGSVGETEQALRKRGAEYVKSAVPYADVPKGAALKERHGLAKLLAAPDGRILGFHVVGPEASILLHQVVPVMRWRNHVASLTGAITVHPSLNELVAATAWEVLEKLPKGI